MFKRLLLVALFITTACSDISPVGQTVKTNEFGALREMEVNLKTLGCTFEGDDTKYDYKLTCDETTDEKVIAGREAAFITYLTTWKELALKHPLADNRTGFVSRSIAIDAELAKIQNLRIQTAKNEQDRMKMLVGIAVSAVTDEERAGEIIQILIDHKWDLKSDSAIEAFLTLAADGKTELVKQMLRAGMAPDALLSEKAIAANTAKFSSAQTALMIASRSHKLGTMKALLDANANAKAKDSRGMNAMFYAYKTSAPSAFVVRQLETAGLSVNDTDTEGNNVLMATLIESPRKDMDQLISITDMKAKNNKGQNVYEVAKEALKKDGKISAENAEIFQTIESVFILP